jgi:hypothetical protein
MEGGDVGQYMTIREKDSKTTDALQWARASCIVTATRRRRPGGQHCGDIVLSGEGRDCLNPGERTGRLAQLHLLFEQRGRAFFWHGQPSGSDGRRKPRADRQNQSGAHCEFDLGNPTRQELWHCGALRL